MPRTWVKTIFRWTWRLFVLACILLLLAVCTALVCLPRILEPAIARELANRGFDNVEVQVQGVYWHSATLGPIVIREGNDTLSLDAVRLRYQPAALRRGRIEAIHVSGLACTVRHEHGEWRVVGEGTLRRLADACGATGAATPQPAIEDGAPTTAGTAPSDVCPRITVRSSQVCIVHGPEKLTIPVAADVRLDPGAPVAVDATLAPFGSAVRVEARLDLTTGAGAATLEWQRVQLPDVLPWLAVADVALPPGLAGLNASTAGTATLTLRDWKPHELTAELTARELRAEYETSQVRVRELRVTGASGADLAAAAVRCHGDQAWLLAGAATVGPLALDAAWQGRTGEVSATAIPFRIGADVQGSASLWATITLDETGQTPSAKARLEFGPATVRGARLNAGVLEVSGTPDDVEFNTRWEVQPSVAAYGVTAVAGRGRFHRAATPALTAAGTVSIRPEPVMAEFAPAITLDAAPQPFEWSIDASRPTANQWQGACRLVLPETTRTLTFANGKATAAAVALTAELSGTPAAAVARLDVSLRDGAGEYDTAQASFGNARLTLETAPARLPFPAFEPGPDAPPGWHTVLTTLNASGRLEVTGAACRVGTDVECQGIALDLPLELKGRALSGRLDFTSAECRIGTDIECRDVSLTMPFEWTRQQGFARRDDNELPGRIALGALRIGPIDATAFHAACALEGSTLRSEGTLDLKMPRVPVKVWELLDWSNGLRAHVRYETPQVRLTGGDLPPRLAADLSGMALSGEVSVAGEMTYDDAGLRTPVRFTLANGELRWDANKLAVTGIAANVAFEDILTLRSRPHQEVRFTSAKASDVPIDGGRIVLQAESWESLFIEHCQMNWCGGVVHTEAFTFNPYQPEFDITLFADRVDLVQALSLVKGFTGKGSGVLHGKLPVSFRNGRFSYATGYLYSIPGHEGRLQLDKPGFLTGGVPADDPNFAQLRQAEEALQDLRVDMFRLDFAGQQTGSPSARLSLAGKSSKPGLPPVRLDVNFNGAIEEAINVGLRIGGF